MCPLHCVPMTQILDYIISNYIKKIKTKSHIIKCEIENLCVPDGENIPLFYNSYYLSYILLTHSAVGSVPFGGGVVSPFLFIFLYSLLSTVPSGVHPPSRSEYTPSPAGVHPLSGGSIPPISG